MVEEEESGIADSLPVGVSSALAYYSRGMAARSPRQVRRRPRPGSLDRPINARMYRGTWLLVGLPLLVAAFSIGRPAALDPPPLPPTFDAEAALALTRDLAGDYPDRSPGSIGAARWVSDRLSAYGFETQTKSFEATIPGRGRVRLQNLVAKAVGRSPDAIVVMADRDNSGQGRGANDNASGTAVLIELARGYARASASSSAGGSVRPAHTIVFLSSDGGAFGSLGAARFAVDPEYRDRIVAVVNLDAVAGRGPPRIQLAGDRPRSPSPALVETAADRILEQTGAEPERPGALHQLIDLGFPFSLYGQAPFVAHGIPAITLTTAADRPPSAFDDTTGRLSLPRLNQLGRSAQALVASLDEGLELAPGTSAYVYLGPRIVPGWAVQLVLIAALLPFLAAAVDLFARCRRRRIPLMPALRSYRSRLAFWLFAGLVFAALALFGAWPHGEARPLAPETAAAGRWPVAGLVALGVLAVAGWFVARERLLPRRTVGASEELAGYTVALLVLAVISLVVIATNAFALLFVLPSLHAWIWLPQLRDRRPLLRAAVLAAGLAGPLLLLVSFAVRFGLGLDTPWYLASLVAVGYVNPVSVAIFLAWLAAAAQLAALAARRYAPYPSVAERPARGPLRELVRRSVLVLRGARRRRATDSDDRALEA
jgi:Peptidase family M28